MYSLHLGSTEIYHSVLEFGVVTETDITTGFGRKCRTAFFNTKFYFIGPFFVVLASGAPLRTAAVLVYLLVT